MVDESMCVSVSCRRRRSLIFKTQIPMRKRHGYLCSPSVCETAILVCVLSLFNFNHLPAVRRHVFSCVFVVHVNVCECAPVCYYTMMYLIGVNACVCVCFFSILCIPKYPSEIVHTDKTRFLFDPQPSTPPTALIFVELE